LESKVLRISSTTSALVFNLLESSSFNCSLSFLNYFLASETFYRILCQRDSYFFYNALRRLSYAEDGIFLSYDRYWTSGVFDFIITVKSWIKIINYQDGQISYRLFWSTLNLFNNTNSILNTIATTYSTHYPPQTLPTIHYHSPPLLCNMLLFHPYDSISLWLPEKN
jgi:hypothetical protein